MGRASPKGKGTFWEEGGANFGMPGYVRGRYIQKGDAASGYEYCSILFSRSVCSYYIQSANVEFQPINSTISALF